jgi:hypothetical protein
MRKYETIKRQSIWIAMTEGWPESITDDSSIE